MIRVTTTGSLWLFDPGGRYLRMPLNEQPREDPAWGTTPGPLEDNVWHDFAGLAIINRGHTVAASLAPETNPEKLWSP